MSGRVVSDYEAYLFGEGHWLKAWERMGARPMSPGEALRLLEEPNAKYRPWQELPRARQAFWSRRASEILRRAEQIKALRAKSEQREAGAPIT